MFIVIEGLDGAGKSTQVKKLTDYLASTGKKLEYLHFPRFDAPIYGDLIARFLRGDLGQIDQVDPRLVALIYAGDRAEAAGTIRQWLHEDKIVLVDRYVYSNIAYQCAKTEDKTALRNWILELEYAHNKIPRPDITLFLDVPFKFTERSLTTVRKGDDRSYLDGKQDIHEASLSFQQKVQKEYLACAPLDADFHILNCGTLTGEMATADDIFTKIKDAIQHLL